jgi:transcriptional regulator with XRE-family HTH domain
MTEDEAVRLRNLLRSAVSFADVTQREVERKLGMSSGTLSRLFSGGIELRIKHVLDVCEVIGFPPSRFFHAAYPELDEPSGSAWRVQRLLEQLHPNRQGAMPARREQEPPPVASLTTQADVERLVMTALAKFFAGFGGAP